MFQTDVTLIELLKQGGVTIYILVFCSVITIAVILERWVSLSRMLGNGEKLIEGAGAMLKENNFSAVTGILESTKGSIAGMFLAGFNKRDKGREEIAETMDVVRMIEGKKMRRYIWVLAIIGSTAVFIGLFGTVVGIMKAFLNIAKQGAGGPTVVALGISEALVATATGLVVAIMAVVAYNMIVAKITSMSEDLKIYQARFIDLLKK